MHSPRGLAALPPAAAARRARLHAPRGDECHAPPLAAQQPRGGGVAGRLTRRAADAAAAPAAARTLQRSPFIVYHHPLAQGGLCARAHRHVIVKQAIWTLLVLALGDGSPALIGQVLRGASASARTCVRACVWARVRAPERPWRRGAHLFKAQRLGYRGGRERRGAQDRGAGGCQQAAPARLGACGRRWGGVKLCAPPHPRTYFPTHPRRAPPPGGLLQGGGGRLHRQKAAARRS